MMVTFTAITPSAATAVSTLEHEQAWWAAEAVRTGSDWPGVIDAAFEIMVAGGVLEPEPETLIAWDVPSWRQGAIDYHRDRPGRPAVEIESKWLARLRRLMADDVSLEHAWHEFREKRPNFRISNDR